MGEIQRRVTRWRKKSAFAVMAVARRSILCVICIVIPVITIAVCESGWCAEPPAQGDGVDDDRQDSDYIVIEYFLHVSKDGADYSGTYNCYLNPSCFINTNANLSFIIDRDDNRRLTLQIGDPGNIVFENFLHLNKIYKHIVARSDKSRLYRFHLYFGDFGRDYTGSIGFMHYDLRYKVHGSEYGVLQMILR